MSEGMVAERYAQALFEIGSESGQLPLLADKMIAFADLYASSRELKKTLENPILDPKARDGILGEVSKRLGLPDIAVKSLMLMGRRGRLSIVVAVASRLRQLSDEKAGVLRAQVTTAQKMPESYYSGITDRLAQITKKKIVLERAEEPSLLGGAIARVGDLVIDGSVRGRLEETERGLVAALSASFSASSAT